MALLCSVLLQLPAKGARSARPLFPPLVGPLEIGPLETRPRDELREPLLRRAPPRAPFPTPLTTMLTRSGKKGTTLNRRTLLAAALIIPAG